MKVEAAVDRILTDLSAPALVAAMKNNLYACLVQAGQTPVSEFGEDDGLARWHTRVPMAMFNGVLCRRPPRAGDEALLARTLDEFRARGTRDLTWWLTPDVDRAAWEPMLCPAGFSLVDGPPGMALDLQQLPEHGPAPAALRIAPVTDIGQLAVWAHVFVEGYGMPADWESRLLELFAGFGLDWPLRSYLGYLGETPVATASLFLAAGVAGIYNIATLPAARGQGVGAALTLAPLYDARARGYRAAILQSSEMGFPVYRRLGFEQLCTMEHFYRSAPA